jgi:hypothetical protein
VFVPGKQSRPDPPISQPARGAIVDTGMRGNPDGSRPWYDFVVLCDSDAGFCRRFAGRVETGRHAFSDPAMGFWRIGSERRLRYMGVPP